MLRIACSGCGKTYQVPEKFAGKKMRCKQCATPIEIPAAESVSPAPRALEETAELGDAEREELHRTRRRARQAHVRSPRRHGKPP